MEWLTAIILGIIQGLTEFLPVSSSGHLELTKYIFGDSSAPEESMLMTVVLHAATALSTMVIFRKDIMEIVRGLFQFKWNDEMKFSLKIIISMIQAGLVGILFKDEIESLFNSQILLVGFMLLLTGALLFLADRAKTTEKPVSNLNALIIGIAQAIAILPGISRSGATISISVLLKIDRSKAARFSFLMVVPLILGAIAMDMKDIMETSSLEGNDYKARTEMIMANLEEDEILSSDELVSIESAMLEKEMAWDAFKQNEAEDMDELKASYITSLKDAGISELQVASIVSHDWGKVRSISGHNYLALLLGFIASFLTGLLACTWMIKLVKKAKLSYFAYYCFAIGTASIIYMLAV